MVIDRPGWDLIHESQKELTFPLRGPKTLRSSGCSLCEQCGGKDNITIPLARQNSIPLTERWEEWLSSINRTLVFTDALVWRWKWWRNWIKCSSTIQPEELAVPMQPGGPSRMKWSLKWTHGNMNIGGIMYPKALPAHARVTRVPLSPDVTDPTCLSPRLVTTCSGSWTVEIPVSSMFQMSLPSNLCLSRTFSRLSKNIDTLCLLKLMFLDRLVAWGRRIERLDCLFMNPVNQSRPAKEHSFQVWGNLHL